jgi:hypothetical protein
VNAILGQCHFTLSHLLYCVRAKWVEGVDNHLIAILTHLITQTRNGNIELKQKYNVEGNEYKEKAVCK